MPSDFESDCGSAQQVSIELALSSENDEDDDNTTNKATNQSNRNRNVNQYSNQNQNNNHSNSHNNNDDNNNNNNNNNTDNNNNNNSNAEKQTTENRHSHDLESTSPDDRLDDEEEHHSRRRKRGTTGTTVAKGILLLQERSRTPTPPPLPSSARLAEPSLSAQSPFSSIEAPILPPPTWHSEPPSPIPEKTVEQVTKPVPTLQIDLPPMMTRRQQAAANAAVQTTSSPQVNRSPVRSASESLPTIRPEGSPSSRNTTAMPPPDIQPSPPPSRRSSSATAARPAAVAARPTAARAAAASASAASNSPNVATSPNSDTRPYGRYSLTESIIKKIDNVVDRFDWDEYARCIESQSQAASQMSVANVRADSLIIHFDGGCRDLTTSNKKSDKKKSDKQCSVGVWISWEPELWVASILDTDVTTAQQAELYGGLVSLVLALRLFKKHGIKLFTLRGDSQYVLFGLKYQDCRRKQNKGIWDQLFNVMEALDRHGVEIRIQWGYRNTNRTADAVATSAFSGKPPIVIANDMIPGVMAHDECADRILQAALDQRKPTWIQLPAEVMTDWTQLMELLAKTVKDAKGKSQFRSRLAVFVLAPAIFLRRKDRNKVADLRDRLKSLILSGPERGRFIIDFIRDAESETLPPRSNDQRTSYRAAEEQIMKGACAKALQTAFSEGFAEFNEANVATVKNAIYKMADDPLTSEFTVGASVPTVRRERIRSACRQTGRLKAKGISSWTRELFLPTLESNVTAAVWESYITAMSHYDVENIFAPLHCTNSLAPLIKPAAAPGASAGIRPVGIGCYLMKIAWKCMCGTVEKEIDDNLPPNQVISKKDGLKSAVKFAQSALDKGDVVFIGDCSGAFNALARKNVLDILKKKESPLNRLLGLFMLEFNEPKAIWYVDGRRRDTFPISGVNQGSTPSTKFFGMATRDPLLIFPQNSFAATDDIIISGKPRDIFSRVQRVADEYKKLGLNILGGKQRFVAHRNLHGVLARNTLNAPVLEADLILGAWISSGPHATLQNFKRLQVAHERTKKLTPHISKHAAGHMWRGLSKRWIYAFSTSAHKYMSKLSEVVTDDISENYLRVAELRDPKFSTSQLYSSLDVGGFGLVNWRRYFAFASQHDGDGKSVYAEIMDKSSVEYENDGSRRNTNIHWRQMMCWKHKDSTMKRSVRPWLSSFAPQPWNRLTDEEYVFGMHLLSNSHMILPTADKCTIANNDYESNSDHVLGTCPACAAKYRTMRHDNLCRIFASIARQSGFTVTRDLKSHFSHLSREVQGPDIMVYSHDVIYLIDLTVVHVTQDSKTCNAVHERFLSKKHKYRNFTLDSLKLPGKSLVFFPLVLTTTGIIFHECLPFLRDMSRNNRYIEKGFFGKLVYTLSAAVIKETLKSLHYRILTEVVGVKEILYPSSLPRNPNSGNIITAQNSSADVVLNTRQHDLKDLLDHLDQCDNSQDEDGQPRNNNNISSTSFYRMPNSLSFNNSQNENRNTNNPQQKQSIIQRNNKSKNQANKNQPNNYVLQTSLSSVASFSSFSSVQQNDSTDSDDAVT